jgi:tryptophanyl-tRNA synthetase
MIKYSLSFYYSIPKKNILLTGIQPTGNIHIGNYLGSINNMLKLQSSEEYSYKYLMIADYHSLTTALHY